MRQNQAELIRRGMMIKKITRLNQSAKIHLLFLWGVIAMFGGIASADEESLPKPIFKLTKGKGTEVCKAYLQRLNATEFVENDPIKGRITEPLLKGFVDLKPVPLTAEEIQRLYYKIESFDRYRNQDLLKKYMEIHKNDKEEAWRIRDAQKLPEKIKNIMSYLQKTPIIRYQKELDMDNDGVVSNTVIKRNYGVYIVDSGLQQIDEEKMIEIFADKEILDWPTITQFPPIAMSNNIFNYKGKYYFDGFLNLIFYNAGHGIDTSIPVKIAVFIYQHQQTKKVCEYQWFNKPVTRNVLIIYPGWVSIQHFHS
jgi:hypothetical protein